MKCTVKSVMPLEGSGETEMMKNCCYAPDNGAYLPHSDQITLLSTHQKYNQEKIHYTRAQET